MKIYQFDPTQDPRWARFVEQHPRASVFHSVAWLQALRQTYEYEPVAFTTSPPTSELKNGLVLCRIRSWVTGSRLVSLPFSDHCEPLCDTTEDLDFLIRYLQTLLERKNWKYLEVRPINGKFGYTSENNNFKPATTYLLHVLDLRPELHQLFRSLDKDSIQRRIRRAERGGLVEKCGNSDDLLKDFYGLFVMTRKRHGLPPPPYSWFANLVQHQGESLEIRVAYKDKKPISAMLNLKHKDTVYYKYGCSDSAYNNFGATPWLFWRAIVEAKSNGATKFDLGRTEEDNKGLVAFKNHWTPEPSRLFYWKFPGNPSLDSPEGWKLKLAKRVFSIMPKALLEVTGKMLYRHIG
jgi:hypothetical protein